MALRKALTCYKRINLIRGYLPPAHMATQSSSSVFICLSSPEVHPSPPSPHGVLVVAGPRLDGETRLPARPPPSSSPHFRQRAQCQVEANPPDVTFTMDDRHPSPPKSPPDCGGNTAPATGRPLQGIRPRGCPPRPASSRRRVREHLASHHAMGVLVRRVSAASEVEHDVPRDASPRPVPRPRLTACRIPLWMGC
ncbi:lysine-rich arabinogalactan protein 19-like [Penaeus monodon]|uniref:lysine-rich arabinogalactan protein 19-like n=1 Tax=Penaeus monodon TaxID=6687 RepID=UPI0018A76520|nr:lysine-rich arabinogalactan protein 19-like [Penaeus monodon]